MVMIGYHFEQATPFQMPVPTTNHVQHQHNTIDHPPQITNSMPAPAPIDAQTGYNPIDHHPLLDFSPPSDTISDDNTPYTMTPDMMILPPPAHSDQATPRPPIRSAVL